MFWQMDILLCPSCEQKFSPILRRPLILSCGHTLCQLCIERHQNHCENGDHDIVSENTVILQMLGEGVDAGETGTLRLSFYSHGCLRALFHYSFPKKKLLYELSGESVADVSVGGSFERIA